MAATTETTGGTRATLLTMTTNAKVVKAPKIIKEALPKIKSRNMW